MTDYYAAFASKKCKKSMLQEHISLSVCVRTRLLSMYPDRQVSYLHNEYFVEYALPGSHDTGMVKM